MTSRRHSFIKWELRFCLEGKHIHLTTSTQPIKKFKKLWFIASHPCNSPPVNFM
jgi:hypothetical protein